MFGGLGGYRRTERGVSTSQSLRLGVNRVPTDAKSGNVLTLKATTTLRNWNYKASKKET